MYQATGNPPTVIKRNMTVRSEHPLSFADKQPKYDSKRLDRMFILPLLNERFKEEIASKSVPSHHGFFRSPESIVQSEVRDQKDTFEWRTKKKNQTGSGIEKKKVFYNHAWCVTLFRLSEKIKPGSNMCPSTSLLSSRRKLLEEQKRLNLFISKRKKEALTG